MFCFPMLPQFFPISQTLLLLEDKSAATSPIQPGGETKTVAQRAAKTRLATLRFQMVQIVLHYVTIPSSVYMKPALKSQEKITDSHFGYFRVFKEYR